jgi:predicted regulator of Ras-like GTPase activity (Roadblock/LC7/MglB family)
MIDEVATVHGVRHVAVTTSDGLVRVRSEQTSMEEAERLGQHAPACIHPAGA